MNLLKSAYVILLVIFLIPTSIFAQNQNVTAELLIGDSNPLPGNPFYVAVKLTMQNGWHTYWRNPGDAGLATTIEWDLPEEYVAEEILWPTPKKLIEPDIVSFIYEDEVLLISLIKPINSRVQLDTVEIRAKVSWLECKGACLPGSADLSIIAATDRNGLDENELFRKWLTKMPYKTGAKNFSAYRDNKIIELKFSSIPVPDIIKGNSNIIFFPYDEGIFDNASTQVLKITEDGFNLNLKLSSMLIKEPSEVYGILVISNEMQNIEEIKSHEIKVPIKEQNNKR